MRNYKNLRDVFKLSATSLLLAGMACAQATELVYTPVNPNFGGSPLNGATLLNQAQAQNRSKDPDDPANSNESAMKQFNDSLQRAVLGRLAAAATSNIETDGKLKPGRLETAGLIVTVTDTGRNTYMVVTTDKSNGAVSSFEISK
jgi:curli production assembly/transport component CsgF